MGYPNFLSPGHALKKDDISHIDKTKNFCISDSKMHYRQTPTPTPKKEIDYCASGDKIFKEEQIVGELNSQLFSQDLGDEENNKSPFSFLKRTNSLPASKAGDRGPREAFNNITNTLNKSPFFEDKQSSSKITDALAPKFLKFEANKQ